MMIVRSMETFGIFVCGGRRGWVGQNKNIKAPQLCPSYTLVVAVPISVGIALCHGEVQLRFAIKLLINDNVFSTFEFQR